MLLKLLKVPLYGAQILLVKGATPRPDKDAPPSIHIIGFADETPKLSLDPPSAPIKVMFEVPLAANLKVQSLTQV